MIKKHQGDETRKKRFIHGFSEQFKAGHLALRQEKEASSIPSKYCIYSFEVISAVLAAAAAGGGGVVVVVVVVVGILGHQQIDHLSREGKLTLYSSHYQINICLRVERQLSI